MMLIFSIVGQLVLSALFVAYAIIIGASGIEIVAAASISTFVATAIHALLLWRQLLGGRGAVLRLFSFVVLIFFLAMTAGLSIAYWLYPSPNPANEAEIIVRWWPILFGSIGYGIAAFYRSMPRLDAERLILLGYEFGGLLILFIVGNIYLSKKGLPSDLPLYIGAQVPALLLFCLSRSRYIPWALKLAKKASRRSYSQAVLATVGGPGFAAALLAIWISKTL